MAIEFGSRKETFENFKVYETTLAGRPFKVEMGKMCGLSNASALIRYGETCVMCNVVMSPKPREGVDFFPLNVEYEEKLYAAGRIPGSFMRREGRPGERAILTSRVVDRPMRPLFPKEMRNDVCITMTVMSLDPDCSPEIAGMIGASLVTAVSEIPWNGPIGGVQVGLVDGEIVLNPTQEQRKKSDLALTVAATMDKIVMIEAGANEVDEDTMLNAIKAAHVEIKKTIAFINEIVAERGKPKIDFQVVGLDMDVFHAIKEKYLDDFKAAMDTDSSHNRRSPSRTRSGRTRSKQSTTRATSGAKPPVATNATGPSSVLVRRAYSPSVMDAKPNRKPWFRLVTVLRPTMGTSACAVSAIRGSCAVRVANAPSEDMTPGQISPPR